VFVFCQRAPINMKLALATVRPKTEKCTMHTGCTKVHQVHPPVRCQAVDGACRAGRHCVQERLLDNSLQSRDPTPTTPCLPVVALLPLFPIRNTNLPATSLRVSHGRSGPSFKTWFPPRAVFGSRCEQNMQGLVPFKALCLEYIHSSISNVWFK
jgi:hypothetical protein